MVQPKQPLTPEQRTAALIRMLTSDNDGDVLAAVHAWRRLSNGTGLDIHTTADRIEQSNGASKALNAAQMQKIYDKGYGKGFEDGREQGRRSVILAGAASVQHVVTGNAGPGVNGYSWATDRRTLPRSPASVCRPRC